MALIPTLKLWPYELKREGLPAELVELVLGNGVAQTRAFAELRGQLLFRTDVGYMIDYDPTEEFVYLQRARLAPAQILCDADHGAGGALRTREPNRTPRARLLGRRRRARRRPRAGRARLREGARHHSGRAHHLREDVVSVAVRPPLRPHAALLHQHLTTVMALYHEMETV